MVQNRGKHVFLTRSFYPPIYVLPKAGALISAESHSRYHLSRTSAPWTNLRANRKKGVASRGGDGVIHALDSILIHQNACPNFEPAPECPSEARCAAPGRPRTPPGRGSAGGVFVQSSYTLCTLHLVWELAGLGMGCSVICSTAHPGLLVLGPGASPDA